tara:strand:- start:229 stop:366 length:138 start_codon:yes stop_codon:yes gene_type:complete
MLAIGTYSTDSALVLNNAGLRMLFTAVSAVKREVAKPESDARFIC